MKLKNILYILLIFLVSSCKKNDDLVYGYNLISDRTQVYKLEKSENDSIKHFKYINQKDTLGNLNVTYNIMRNKILINNKNTLVPLNKEYNFKNTTFKYFIMEKSKTGGGVIVFNEVYGILSSFTFGAHFIFLKEEKTKESKTELFNDIRSKVFAKPTQKEK